MQGRNSPGRSRGVQVGRRGKDDDELSDQFCFFRDEWLKCDAFLTCYLLAFSPRSRKGQHSSAQPLTAAAPPAEA